SWSRFFAPAPAATPVQQASAPSCAREPSQEIACAAKADRQAMAGAAAKAAGPGASGLIRGHERSRSPQLASAGANKDPLTTNSIAPAAARPVAVPEARPTTIEGWAIREGEGGEGVRGGPSGRGAGGAGRYGAGNRTDRFDRTLGQPLDRCDDQGPDLDPKLIFNEKRVRSPRAIRRRYGRRSPLSALITPVCKRKLLASCGAL